MSAISLRRFLAYVLPVAVFLLIDHLLGRQPYGFPNDNIPGQFGLGLNLVTGYFGITFHHPAFPIIEIAAALAAKFKDAPDLNGFFQAGRLIHVGIAIAAAAWMARLAGLAALRPWQVALLSMTALSMPTMALYAPLLVSYFPAGILLPPMAVGLYLLASRRDLPRWTAPSLYGVFGLQLSMLFPSLALLAAMGVGLLIMLRAKDAEHTAAFAPVWPRSDRVAHILLFVCLLVWMRTCLDAVQMPGRDLLWIVAALAALGLVIVPGRYGKWWALQRGVVLPTLAGWLLGCNVMVMDWGASAHGAFVAKGGASPRLPFAEVWQRADVLRYVAAWHWHWFIVVLAFATVALWLGLLVLGNRRHGGLPFVAVFCTLALGLTVWTSADVSFLAPSMGWEQFGQESRYFIMVIAPVALVGVVGFVFSKTTSIITALVYSAIVALSFADYYSAARAVWPPREATEERLEQELAAHLAASPRNIVWCLRVIQPRQCALLYGFNNYRVGGSVAKLDRRALDNGRIRYAVDLASACGTPGACQAPGEDLFISDSEPPPTAAAVVQTDTGLYAFRLQSTWPKGTAR